MSFADQWTFFREFRNRFETTGSILPSSRFLARAITGPLREHPRARALRVLEIGPGTGAFTGTIVSLLQPGDRFDLVEINDNFAALLRERFQSDPVWMKTAAQSEIHHCPLQEFRSEGQYDVIISGLPFNNFPVPLVEELVGASWDLLAPGGTYSFFEYMFVRSIRCVVSKKADRERLSAIEAFLQGRFRENRFRRNWVFPNVPPAWVQHLRKP
jgi:phosphatidylethanolamine/phosphatidyl-N-methylethanolamine N-methyltransferase